MEKDKRDDELMEVGAVKARRLSANATPIGGYVSVVDGKFKTQCESSKDAMLAGMELQPKVSGNPDRDLQRDGAKFYPGRIGRRTSQAGRPMTNI